MRRRLMLRSSAGVSPVLPAEYQQVEWIASSGTQAINTGIFPNANIVVKAAFEKPNEAGVNVFGSCGSKYNVNTFILSYNLNGNVPMLVCYAGSSVHPEGNSIIPVRYINNFIVSMDFEKIVIGNADTQEEATYQYERIYGDFTGTNPLTIFARNQDGEYKAFSSYKLKRFQIENSGVLQRSFIPCYRKADGAVGLFDVVSNAFFTNAGTGVFTKGADVS